MTHDVRNRAWTIARLVPLLAGTLVLLSTTLAVTLSPWWSILAVLVGANLLLYSAVGWCPASLLMARLGIPAGTIACAHPQS
ncbi:YgaP family membrane protein [Nocardia amamiensis]|uniref:YgaP family membrane protein n=1 Tax=Nocardia TaxID=1817 RepID=UPI0033F540D9